MASALIGPRVKVVSPLYPAAKSSPGKCDPRSYSLFRWPATACPLGETATAAKVPHELVVPDCSALDQDGKRMCAQKGPEFSESVVPHPLAVSESLVAGLHRFQCALILLLEGGQPGVEGRISSSPVASSLCRLGIPVCLHDPIMIKSEGTCSKLSLTSCSSS